MTKIKVTKARFEAKIKVTNSKPIICIETGEVFDSATELAKEKGLVYASLIAALRKGNPHKGMHYSYVVDLAYNVNVLCDVLTEAYRKANANAQILHQFTELAGRISA